MPIRILVMLWNLFKRIAQRVMNAYRVTTFFATGVDENSLKNALAAEKAGRNVKEFVDEKASSF